MRLTEEDLQAIEARNDLADIPALVHEVRALRKLAGK